MWFGFIFYCSEQTQLAVSIKTKVTYFIEDIFSDIRLEIYLFDFVNPGKAVLAAFFHNKGWVIERE